jgi:phosphopantothenoylcysteine decarboxylase / phosphopantothenate---cysteine ligase
MFSNKKIIVGISGGVAAYKTIFLIRELRKRKAEVKVVLTQNALRFVTRVTLESLSGNNIYVDVFGEINDYSSQHIALSDWGDLFVVAPATANIIGKMANGIADDALSTALVAFDKPIFVAPSMNPRMYGNFAVQRNINFLQSNGIRFVEPGTGELACGWEGKGRMAEPEQIIHQLESYLKKKAL